LALKFAKSANKSTTFFCQNLVWVLLMQKFMLNLNPLKKLQQTHAKKVIKKVTEKWRFLLLLLCATKFFGL
jgi:hypothetical protein